MRITLIPLVLATFAPLGLSEPLYTRQGDDPPFEEVMRGGKLPVGSNSNKGVAGSRVRVNRQLVELTPEAKRPIPQNIRIHTLGNSVIPRRNFGKWSRWYQEDAAKIAPLIHPIARHGSAPRQICPNFG